MITYILAHKSAQVNTNKEFMGARFTDIRGILTQYYVQNAKKGAKSRDFAPYGG